jgi:hypothetical protein
VKHLICLDCDAPFVTQGKSAKYCPSCREERNRQRSKERRQRDKSHSKQAHPLIHYRQYHDYEEDRVPIIPPEKRREMALQAKAEALGMSLSWVKETWLLGEAGKHFLAMGRYL